MFFTLQMGRGLAALAVCGFHLAVAFGDPKFASYIPFAHVASFGRFGVNFFFALSGFIILHAHAADMGRPERIKNFALKRFVRIYPLYWLATLIVLVGAAITHRALNLTAGDLTSIATLVRITTFSHPLIPAWTLFHEVFFYAMFLTLLVHRTAGVAALGLWVVLILTINVGSQSNSASLPWLALHPINLCFFGGMAAYGLYHKLSVQAAKWCIAASTVLLVATEAWIDESSSGLFFQSSLTLVFMLLLSGLVALERQGKIKNIPVFNLLGNASYTLYLLHGIILRAVLKFIYAAGIDKLFPPGILFFLALGAICVISVAVHNMIEKPVTQSLGRWMFSRKTPAPAYP